MGGILTINEIIRLSASGVGNQSHRYDGAVSRGSREVEFHEQKGPWRSLKSKFGAFWSLCRMYCYSVQIMYSM